MMYLPDYVLEMLKTIRSTNQEAYLVGGCVRDILMAQEAADYDITTTATIDQLKQLFPRVIPVGEKHGTVIVLSPDGQRVEVSALKSRCQRYEQAATLEDDLRLRDFTINAMAMDEKGRIIDPYGGRTDLKHKMIRSPLGESQDRFREDPLRMMRAVRFAVTLGFALDEDLHRDMMVNAPLICDVAVERVRSELDRILVSDYPAQGMRLMNETGLLRYILPEVQAMVGFEQRNFRHDKDIFEHSLAALDAVPPRLKVRLAALLHDVGKPVTFTIDANGVGHFYNHHLEGSKIAADLLGRLKYDKQMIEDVSRLVAAHMSRFAQLKDNGLIKLVRSISERNWQDLLDLQKADIVSSAPPYDFSGINAMQEDYDRILREKRPMDLKDLTINGRDLIALGYKPGPAMGELLKHLLEVVLNDAQQNRKEILIDLARDFPQQDKEE